MRAPNLCWAAVQIIAAELCIDAPTGPVWWTDGRTQLR